MMLIFCVLACVFQLFRKKYFKIFIINILKYINYTIINFYNKKYFLTYKNNILKKNMFNY